MYLVTVYDAFSGQATFVVTCNTVWEAEKAQRVFALEGKTSRIRHQF